MMSRAFRCHQEMLQVTDIFIFYGNGWQTNKHPSNTDFYNYVQKYQKANLRAQCCTEHRSTPLWQQKQYLTCRYLAASSALWPLRLNPRLMGI